MVTTPTGRTGRPAARPTISDVAARAGVDRAVVSKVLSGDPGLRVRDETRERVRRAADDLGYLPNFHARGLARARAGALGLLVPDGNPLFHEVMAGAEEAATERDLLLSTATHRGDLPQRFLRLLRGGIVDALLVSGLRAEVDAQALFRETRVPVLLVNRRSRGSDRWVILDDERAARMATEHLLALGHREVAFLGGPPGVDTAERRLAGFRAAMAAAGLPVPGSRVVHAAYQAEAGEAAVGELLARVARDDAGDGARRGGDDGARGGAGGGARRAAGGDRPTAIVTVDAPLGLGAWHALAARGIAVPRDVSLIAIHRLPFEEYRVPALTCVQLPLRTLGRRAAELVLDTPPDAPIRELIAEGVTLFQGDTTAAPR